jgi:hypothetical protein
LIEHGPDHVLEFRLKARHQLPKLALHSAALTYVILLICDVRLAQDVGVPALVQADQVIEYGTSGIDIRAYAALL